MTTENENNDSEPAGRKRVAPACEVFDMLTAHAEQYQTAITISKVQQDIRDTLGVDLDRSAVSSRLRNIAAKGLIVRAGDGEDSRGWWAFSARVLRRLGREPAKTEQAAKPRRQPRGLLKRKNVGKNREFREVVETYIRSAKKRGRDLVFTTDSIVDFLRLNNMPCPPRDRIAKAVGNMIFQQCGVVKTNRPAVYCVPANEERFNKSAVRRPDVAEPKSVRRKGTTPRTTTELRTLFREAAEGHAAIQKALVRLSDLIGNFKE